MKIGSLFSGTGALDMAVETVFPGARPAWFCEWDDAPAKILAHHWPDVPNHRDVTAVDWATVEPVDIMTGGSPCQDLSAAGKRAGMSEGTRSNLWVNMREAIASLRPRYVMWENVLGALSATATSDSDLEQGAGLLGDGSGGHLRALGRVLGDLTEAGYDCRWTTVRASDVGAPHHRARVFLIATPTDATGVGLETGEQPGRQPAQIAEHHSRRHLLPDTDGIRRNVRRNAPLAAAGANGATDRHSSVDWGRYRSAVRRGGISNAHTTESRPEEVLRDMWRGVLPETVQWTTRGQNPIPHEEDVRAIVREQQEVRPSGFSPVASASAGPEGSVREVRIEDRLTHSSQGQGPGEQLAGESSSPMRELSPETSLEGGPRVPSVHNQDVDWGPYASAIRRWERVLGRPAPAPTELNTKGKPRLNAAFAEYIMGLPAGHVTGVDIPRAAQLKAIGNGVCPQQAAFALPQLLDLRLSDLSHSWKVAA